MLQEHGTVRSRDITTDSQKSQLLAAQRDFYANSGYLNLLGRVFHGLPKRECSVSYGIGSYEPSHGDRNARKVIHFGSYNYSGLNGHPRILEAAQKALAKYGTTTSGVRLLNGTSDLHVELEQRIASFLNTEDCITYSSGYSANLAAFHTFCDKDDIIFSDFFNHQSINDGLLISGAKVVTFVHRNYDSLEKKLKNVGLGKRKFIVTDGVFSMDGDIAMLDKIVELANKYNAFVVVDDAHGLSAIGPNGRGTAAYFGLTNEVDLITGSLSKGLPGIGGFVAGPKKSIDILRLGSNNYIFSASLPPAIVAGLIEAITILEEQPEIQERLLENSEYLRTGIRELGFNSLESETPIIPVLMPSVEATGEMTKRLYEDGIYVNPVSFPAVSKNKSRLRINVSAQHTKSDLDYCLECLERSGKALGIIS